MASLSALGLLDSGSDTSGGTSAPEPKQQGSPGILSRIGQIIVNAPVGAAQLASDIVRLPYHVARSAITHDDVDIGKTFPAIFGVGKGFQQTAQEFQHPSRILENYGRDPVGSLLNDAANISVVASPIAKAAGIAGQAADAGSLTSRLAAATEKVAAGANRISALPTAPYRLPITKLGEAIGQSTLRGLEAASGSAVQAGKLSNVLATRAPFLYRFAPETKALDSVLLSGKADELHLSHSAFEGDVMPKIKEALGGVSAPAERASIIETYKGQHRAAVARGIADTRNTTAGGVGDLPFSQRVGPAGAAAGQGSFFDELVSAKPTPDGYVRLSDIRQGKTSTAPFKGQDTIAIPKPLADHISSFFQGPSKGAQQLDAVVAPFNRLNYTAKLGLNPAWVVGNAGGNSTMGALGSSLPMSQLKAFLEDFRSQDYVGPNRNYKAAPTDAALESVKRDVGDAGNIAQRATGAIQAGVDKLGFFKLAERLDNASRSAFYRTEIKAGASADLAMEKTIRHMGEFDKMSPFERDYVRKLAPFYSWHREILKIAKNLVEEHPARAAKLAQIGNVESQQPEDAGQGTKLGADQFVPFGQVGETFGGSLLGLGKMLGPLPKIGLAVGTGDNPSTGKDLDVGQGFGERNGPGLHNLLPETVKVGKGMPPVRLEESLRGKDRYTTPLEGLASFLGLDASHTPEKPAKKGSKPTLAQILKGIK